jgi:hypothetical protein
MPSPESSNDVEELRQAAIEHTRDVLADSEFEHAPNVLAEYGYAKSWDDGGLQELWGRGLARIIKGPELYRSKMLQVEHGLTYVFVSETIRRRNSSDTPLSVYVNGLSENPTIGGFSKLWEIELLDREQNPEALALLNTILSGHNVTNDALFAMEKLIPYDERYRSF